MKRESTVDSRQSTVRTASPRCSAIVAVISTLALTPAVALAQGSGPVEVELDKSAAKDLYVSRRPPTPSSPRIPKELLALLEKKEKQANAKRDEAIKLLKSFLATRPTGDSRAEGLFKLAELLWEDTRRQYIADMDAYERKLERCRTRRGCKSPPKEPELTFTEPEKYYRMILDGHPGYKRIDLVKYLIGFSAREDGRIPEAMAMFRRVIDEHPDSPLYHDSWMMVGEWFFQQGEWERAQTAYAEVLKSPGSQSYDLALFKSAWCDWKLGNPKVAANKFARLLRRTEEARCRTNARARRRCEQLRDEALDYLVLVFTEDESVTAKDVYQFLASIGGERYSAAVLKRLAETYFGQGRWERSVEAYRFLIDLTPNALSAARYQREIVNAYLEGLESQKAMAEIRILVDKYGSDSAWAKANRRNQKSVDRVIARTERLVRNLAMGFHADAQAYHKQRNEPDADMYRRAAETYAYYLSAFSENENAAEVRYLRAEILFFILAATDLSNPNSRVGDAKIMEEAGDEFLAVGKSAPVGERHKPALQKAMTAFKRLRPKDIRNRKELSPVDRKFAEATDVYATLFPADDEIVGVIFENGQLFFDYRDYDEAIKRFGLIVTKYPDDKNAGAAGDRLLRALARAEDYENIEEWARKLKKAPSFKSEEKQEELDEMIISSIGKSGDKYAKAGKFEKAAGFYARVPEEFPERKKLAADNLFNAAIMWEKAKKPEKAATVYLTIAERYPESDKAQKSAYTAAQVYESVAAFERAAESYEKVYELFPKSDVGADSLFNAGVLRQALGQNKRAIAHYETYAKRFRRSKDDAEEVAFRVGAVYEDAGQHGRAERAFDDYLRRYRNGKFAVEAQTRAGRAAFKLGKIGRAQKKLRAALARYKRLTGEASTKNARFAAEARYLLGEVLFKQVTAISLDVPPRRVERALARRDKLMEKALNVYIDVIELNDPQWATAALYRIGAITEELVTTIRNTPPPKNLDEQEQEMYRNIVDNYVIDIEEKAIERFQSGYEQALELKVYNEYTKKIREALGRLSPSSFPPEKEVRAAQRIGDRVPEPPIINEVIRDE
jgi:TolA-binding protein